jgi:hypothetical protein
MVDLCNAFELVQNVLLLFVFDKLIFTKDFYCLSLLITDTLDELPATGVIRTCALLRFGPLLFNVTLSDFTKGTLAY